MIKKFNLKDMVKGWFIGDFEPSLHSSKEVEVAVKYYRKGDYEPRHLHKISTEYTTIVNGSVKMDGVIYNEGDIVVIEPGTSTDFEALTDCSTVVVKTPSSKNDKYLVDKK